MLKAIGISLTYSGGKHFAATTAIDHVDLEIKEGSFTTIMGPSGSGKTSLLNVLSGMQKPTFGDVWICDRNLHQMGKDELAAFRRTHLGYIFQNYNLLEGMTIKENVMLPMILDKKEVGVMLEKAEQLLEWFAITDIANKYPHQVSGGQQQRCAIARALMNSTSLVFADEPTGNLDSKSAKVVMRAFEQANQESGATIIMVTHDPYTASCGNRVIFIKDGRIQTEVHRKNNQKAYFKEIMDHLAVLEGEGCDV